MTAQRPRRRPQPHPEEQLIAQLKGAPIRKSKASAKPKPKAAAKMAPVASAPEPQLSYRCTAQTARDLHTGLRQTFGVLQKSANGDLAHLRCGTCVATFDQQQDGSYAIGLHGTANDATSTHQRLMTMPASAWLYHPTVFNERMAKSQQVEAAPDPVTVLPMGPTVTGWLNPPGAWVLDTRISIDEFVSALLRMPFYEIQPPVDCDRAFALGNAVLGLAQVGRNARWRVMVSASGDYPAITEGLFRTQELPDRPGVPIWGYLRMLNVGRNG